MQAGSSAPDDGDAGSSLDLSHFESALEALVGESTRSRDRDLRDGDQAQRLVGRLLIKCVDAARALGVDPEDALRTANFDFEARVNEALSLLDPAGAKRS